MQTNGRIYLWSMEIEKFKEAWALVQKIEYAKGIEDRMRSLKISQVQLYSESCTSFGIYTGNEYGQFIIEKMIEAGVYAAMTVRACAENDLEKL